jgi:GAF domain-containing protein
MSVANRVDQGLKWYERVVGLVAVIGGLITAGGFVAYHLRGRTIPAWEAVVACSGLTIVYLALLLFFYRRQPRSRAVVTVDTKAQARVKELEEEVAKLGENIGEVKTEATSAEIRKRLLFDCLESIQQGIGDDQDWDLGPLVERGVLGPVGGLLTRSEEELVRLAVLVPKPDDETKWTMRWAAGHRPESVRNYEFEIDKTLAGIAYRRGEFIDIPNVRDDPRFVPNPKETRPFAAQFAMPLRVGNDIVGAFSVVSTVEGAFSAADVTFLKVVGAVLDVVLALEMDAQRWVDYAKERGFDPNKKVGGGTTDAPKDPGA